MDMLSKAKAVKNVLDSVKQLKENIEKLNKEIGELKNDAKALSTISTRLEKEINSGSVVKLGEKCQKNNKTTIKDCYECAYEVIKEVVKKDGEKKDGGCCCTIY